MKNINYVINGVLAVAVVILYIMQFSGKKESSVTRTFASAGDTTALLPIAYVNVDSLLLNYNYSKDLNEIILKKQENSRANITQKARSLQGEKQDIQRNKKKKAYKKCKKRRAIRGWRAIRETDFAHVRNPCTAMLYPRLYRAFV